MDEWIDGPLDECIYVIELILCYASILELSLFLSSRLSPVSPEKRDRERGAVYGKVQGTRRLKDETKKRKDQSLHVFL